MNRYFPLVGLLGVWNLVSVAAAVDDFEREPINYTQAKPDNIVSRLEGRLLKGEAKLAYEEHFGYLRSFLAALDTPISSQTLVFSKTSLQRNKISPRAPRSLYFNDNLYVGFCQDGDVLEISAVDPQLGTVFYTLDQHDSEQPRLTRQTDNCLLCHGSSSTKGVPGHVVRSVYADSTGLPILSAGTHRIDQTSPIENRWGGWYVSGQHGGQRHLGNLVVRGRYNPEEEENAAGQNVTDLSERFDTKKFLSPHSDIVALMVLEHQADCHNLLTKANFDTRQALHYELALNRELKQPENHRWSSTTSRIKYAGERLLAYLLFSEEAKITAPIRGTSNFAAEFAARGPRDAKGRSLRDFDLTKRMFKYPCSYLIYSESFDSLPDEVRNHVYGRLHEVLTGADQSEAFAHLSAEDRQAILEILLATKPGLPESWRAAAKGS